MNIENGTNSALRDIKLSSLLSVKVIKNYFQ